MNSIENYYQAYVTGSDYLSGLDNTALEEVSDKLTVEDYMELEADVNRYCDDVEWRAFEAGFQFALAARIQREVCMA